MEKPLIRSVGIIMNGVTGRMGMNQHLMRSIVAIRKQGGVRLSDREFIMPDPVLVGRNPEKLEAVAAQAGITRWTTDLEKVLADPTFTIYFDAQTTNMRVESVKKAIRAGKHIYCEKPTALTTVDAYELYGLAEKRGVKHGVVQDKLWLPGILKLRDLIDTGFFGKILSVRGEFGYWVFEGQAVSCLGATHIPTRWDEQGKPYACTADDAAYSTFLLDNGVVAHFNSSWAVRVRRDDLLTIQVDGIRGSAVAGLRKCWIQPYEATPRPVWNPDMDQPLNFFENWIPVPGEATYDNAFKIQWEIFLRHVVKDEPFRWTLLEGAKGVQLAEKGIESWEKHAWVDIPELKPYLTK
jgi:predicted dehydrogenase